MGYILSILSHYMGYCAGCPNRREKRISVFPMDSKVPGANNLTALADQRVLVVLRDGRSLYGILRSYDQFGNMVLDDTIERLYVDLEFAEEPLGVFLVRGENVVLVGEIDAEEFRSVNRRMGRFKRSLEALYPRYQEVRRAAIAERVAFFDLGTTDMAEYDCY